MSQAPDNKKETVLEAFLRQTDIDDNAADAREQEEERTSAENLMRAYREFHSMPKMREQLDVPTQLPKNTFAEEAKPPKPGEKGFTEIDRWKQIGGKTIVPGEGVDDGLIEMGDMGSEDV